MLCTLQLTTLGNLMHNAELTITNHPNYASPVVADADGLIYDCTGITSTLSIPLGTENKSWSEVKALFQ